MQIQIQIEIQLKRKCLYKIQNTSKTRRSQRKLFVAIFKLIKCLDYKGYADRGEWAEGRFVSFLGQHIYDICCRLLACTHSLFLYCTYCTYAMQCGTFALYRIMRCKAFCNIVVASYF